MQVLSVHKLPVDEAAISEEIEELGEEFESQIRENWEEAWLIVAEGVEDFSKLDYGTPDTPREDRQAAYLEVSLGEGKSAFYLHYLEPESSLRYDGIEVPLPEATPCDAELFSQAPYESPG